MVTDSRFLIAHKAIKIKATAKPLRRTFACR